MIYEVTFAIFFYISTKMSTNLLFVSVTFAMENKDYKPPVRNMKNSYTFIDSSMQNAWLVYPEPLQLCAGVWASFNQKVKEKSALYPGSR